MSFPGGGNGQWVRARNEASAQSFMAEQDTDADALRRAHEARRAVLVRVRSWLARVFRR